MNLEKCDEEFTIINQFMNEEGGRLADLIATMRILTIGNVGLGMMMASLMKEVESLREEVQRLKVEDRTFVLHGSDFRTRVGYTLPAEVAELLRNAREQTDPEQLIGCLAKYTDNPDEVLKRILEDD